MDGVTQLNKSSNQVFIFEKKATKSKDYHKTTSGKPTFVRTFWATLQADVCATKLVAELHDTTSALTLAWASGPRKVANVAPTGSSGVENARAKKCVDMDWWPFKLRGMRACKCGVLSLKNGWRIARKIGAGLKVTF